MKTKTNKNIGIVLGALFIILVLAFLGDKGLLSGNLGVSLRNTTHWASSTPALQQPDTGSNALITSHADPITICPTNPSNNRALIFFTLNQQINEGLGLDIRNPSLNDARVKLIFGQNNLPTGSYVNFWNGRDENGWPVANGTYRYRFFNIFSGLQLVWGNITVHCGA